MEFITTSDNISKLWNALNESPQNPRLHRAERYFLKAFKEGWALHADIQDMLDWLDPRLSRQHFNLKEFSKDLGILWESVCFKPKIIANSTMEYKGLRAEHVTMLLIILERLGFQTDPSRMVELLISDLKSRRKKFLSEAELEIFWFKKTRHKYAPITVTTKDASEIKVVIGKIKTTSGYHITLKGNEKNQHLLIQVQSPKYRNIKRPIEETCKDCGMTWYRGDPESSLKHREQHKIIMSYLDPQPSAAVLAEISKEAYTEIVTSNSPKWKQHEMYLRARAFRRELNFDFIQWLSPNSTQERDKSIEGWLFTNEVGAIVGACSFRKYNHEKRKNWGLQWIWICPRERRKGQLDCRWAKLRAKYGDFHVEPPVSDSMQAFLHKRNETYLMDYPDRKDQS